jgi:hypothetical protein
MRPLVKEGFHGQRKPLAEMEMIEQVDVGKPVEVFKAFTVLRLYLDRALDAPGGGRLDGHPRGVLERGTNDAYGPV